MSGGRSVAQPVDSALDRAPVEHDLGDDNENDRILHTTDVSSKNTLASTGHVSKTILLKQKAREILHISNSRSAVTEPAGRVTLAPSPKSAATPSRLDDHSPKEGLDGLKDFTHHPVQTLKAKTERKANREVANRLVTAEVSHAYDVELVLAQDHMAMANTEEERLSAYQDLEVLKKARQDMFVRWTMDRHVLKIRQLESEPITLMDRSKFTRKDQFGHDKTDWKAYGRHLTVRHFEKYGGQYIGSFAEPPLASQESMSASIERFLVASTPWQEVIMHIRRIYRWESRNETLTYLAIFMLLWVINCVASAILLAIVVQVLRRRLNTQTVEELRENIMRTENSALTALTLTEQIEKRGEHGWIEPLIKEMGPWMLLQLGDMANLLEVLLNFYEWRQPYQTAYTLSLLGIASLAFCLTPSWLLVKAITLSAGIVFFGLFPIASLYPDYRLLASPAKWLFWNIPTHAEWAIARLQTEGARQKTLGVLRGKPPDPNLNLTPPKDGGHSTSGLEAASSHVVEQDHSLTLVDDGVGRGAAPTVMSPMVFVYGSYKCTSGKSSGRLLVTSHDVHFEQTLGHRDQWKMEYDTIHRMEKINRVVSVGSGHDILFIDKHGRSFTAGNVTSRDEVFTQIIGYSSVRWQVVG